MRFVWFLWQKKTSRYMVSHPHADCFNIDACCSCGENLTCHTETGVESGCKPRKQPPPVAVLWCAVNQNTHIKNTQQNTIYLVYKALQRTSTTFANVLETITKSALNYWYVKCLLSLLPNSIFRLCSNHNTGACHQAYIQDGFHRSQRILFQVKNHTRRSHSSGCFACFFRCYWTYLKA